MLNTTSTSHNFPLPLTQEVGSDKVHHAPVLHEVVLQWVPGQHHAPGGTDVLQRPRGAGVAVLDPVALVADHHVWTGPRQRSLHTWTGEEEEVEDLNISPY